jgi:hypothetical protein
LRTCCSDPGSPVPKRGPGHVHAAATSGPTTPVRATPPVAEFATFGRLGRRRRQGPSFSQNLDTFGWFCGTVRWGDRCWRRKRRMRRPETLGGLTPDQDICKVRTSDPRGFTVDPIHPMPGRNTWLQSLCHLMRVVTESRSCFPSVPRWLSRSRAQGRCPCHQTGRARTAASTVQGLSAGTTGPSLATTSVPSVASDTSTGRHPADRSAERSRPGCARGSRRRRGPGPT